MAEESHVAPVNISKSGNRGRRYGPHRQTASTRRTSLLDKKTAAKNDLTQQPIEDQSESLNVVDRAPKNDATSNVNRVSETRPEKTKEGDRTRQVTRAHCDKPDDSKNQPNTATGGEKSNMAPRAPSQKHRNQRQTSSKKQPPRKKKQSPWIKDSEIKKMDNAPLPGQIKVDQNAPANLFWAWPGEKMPPPIWDGRTEFVDADLQGTVELWLNGIVEVENPLGSPLMRDPLAANFSFIIGNSDIPNGRLFFAPSSENDKHICEIVPRSWIPDKFEPGQTLRVFWDQQLHQDPRPQEEDDLIAVKPFWENYLSQSSAAQLPVNHPEHEPCNTTNEPDADRTRREEDKGSTGWIAEYLKDRKSFMHKHCGIGMARPDKDEQRSARATVSATFVAPPVVDTTIKPKLNMFVRGAQDSDMPQITNIYNHHVLNSVRVPEYDAISPDQMLARFKGVGDAHLPFIVAGTHGKRGKKAAKGVRKPDHSTDEILGMAYADDFHSPWAAFRFTVEIGIFVHPAYKRNLVSKCLMDKLLTLLDQYYSPRRGYDIPDPNLGIGIQRLVSRILINLPYCPEDDDKEWLIRYLESWGFKQTGHHEGVAYKLQKRVDMAVFSRATGLEIDPKYPPNLPPPP